MPYRILLTTHHITSRAKVQRLSRAAEQLRVSVLIKKTVKPSGIMICEGDSEKSAREWLSIVKGLHYKGFRLIHSEQLLGPRIINAGKDGVKAVDGTDEFQRELEQLSRNSSESSIQSWWKSSMGFHS